MITFISTFIDIVLWLFYVTYVTAVHRAAADKTVCVFKHSTQIVVYVISYINMFLFYFRSLHLYKSTVKSYLLLCTTFSLIIASNP